MLVAGKGKEEGGDRKEETTEEEGKDGETAEEGEEGERVEGKKEKDLRENGRGDAVVRVEDIKLMARVLEDLSSVSSFDLAVEMLSAKDKEAAREFKDRGVEVMEKKEERERIEEQVKSFL